MIKAGRRLLQEFKGIKTILLSIELSLNPTDYIAAGIL